MRASRCSRCSLGLAARSRPVGIASESGTCRRLTGRAASPLTCRPRGAAELATREGGRSRARKSRPWCEAGQAARRAQGRVGFRAADVPQWSESVGRELWLLSDEARLAPNPLRYRSVRIACLLLGMVDVRERSDPGDSHMTTTRPSTRLVLPLLFLFLFELLEPRKVTAQESGSTLTPDSLTYLVNKDVNGERWTIGVNVAPDDPSTIVNITGVILVPGGAPKFVVCQERPDSIGSLSDVGSTLRFACDGADGCSSTAQECSQSGWTSIAPDVPLPASFLLPPGGGGNLASHQGEPSKAYTRAPDGIRRPESTVSATLWSLLRSLQASIGDFGPVLLAGPSEAEAQAGAPGAATLSFDGLTYLVSKDVGGERWSIAFTYAPVDTGEGVVNRLQSVIGNVFKQDGSAPSFIYCTPDPDSLGTLDDAASRFRFTCSGTGPCLTDARQCAETGWIFIQSGIELAADFFLPPGGLRPSSAQSDSELFVIGRTSDPPSIASNEYDVEEGARTLGVPSGTGSCPVGLRCRVPRVGACDSVAGVVADIAGFGCACRLDDISPSCITCGGGASGRCGGECEYAVGNATARGECLPITCDGDGCVCFAIASGGSQTVRGCGGPLRTVCRSGTACADDPRDGCSLTSGNVTCSGVCVEGACDLGSSDCGTCFLPEGQVCGNRVVEGTEECDGAQLGGASCASLGFGGGVLRCDGRCVYDRDGCQLATPVPSNTPILTLTPTPTRTPTNTRTPAPTQTPLPSPSAGPSGPPEILTNACSDDIYYDEGPGSIDVEVSDPGNLLRKVKIDQLSGPSCCRTEETTTFGEGANGTKLASFPLSCVCTNPPCGDELAAYQFRATTTDAEGHEVVGTNWFCGCKQRTGSPPVITKNECSDDIYYDEGPGSIDVEVSDPDNVLRKVKIDQLSGPSCCRTEETTTFGEGANGTKLASFPLSCVCTNPPCGDEPAAYQFRATTTDAEGHEVVGTNWFCGCLAP
jgi:hypothetical protein